MANPFTWACTLAYGFINVSCPRETKWLFRCKMADFAFPLPAPFFCCFQVIVQGTSLFLPTIISGLGKYTTGALGRMLRVLSFTDLPLEKLKPSSDPYRLTSSRQFGPSASPTLRGSIKSTESSSRRRPRSPSSDTSCSSPAATLKFSTALRSLPSPVPVRYLLIHIGSSSSELILDCRSQSRAVRSSSPGLPPTPATPSLAL
jgi:hypothetical protein